MNESRWNWIPIDDVKLLSLVVLFAKSFRLMTNCWLGEMNYQFIAKFVLKQLI